MSEDLSNFDFSDDLKETFEKATNYVKSQVAKMSSTQLLHLYARFKQVNEKCLLSFMVTDDNNVVLFCI